MKTVTNVRKRVAAVNPRSAPPGIAEVLQATSDQCLIVTEPEDARSDCYPADDMKYIGHLILFHADCHWNLQPQPPAIHIWLHLVPLIIRQNKDTFPPRYLPVAPDPNPILSQRIGWGYVLNCIVAGCLGLDHQTY